MMRVMLACLFGLTASALKSEDPIDRPVANRTWQTPFEPIASDSPSSLSVLMVITNDDPFLSSRPDQPGAAAPTLWCVSQMESAFSALLRDRPDLEDRLVLQGFAAGLPQVLTDGEARQLASRVVIALCDAEYRVLGFHIGVPNRDDLLAFVEDAEEVARSRNLRSREDRQTAVNRMTVRRSQDRLERAWQGVLNELIPEPNREDDDVTRLGGDSETEEDPKLEGDSELEGDPDRRIDRLRLLSIIERLDANYLHDIRRRFGLQGPGDQTRLALLEQHVETRRPWCQALLPLIEGQDFSTLWRDLLELVWYHPPVIDGARDDDLLAWVDHQLDSSAVVLLVEPPLRNVRVAWHPGDDSFLSRVERWRDVNELALEYPFRTVTVQQLALVVQHRQLKPIDIQQPSMARYVFLEPGRPRPLVVGVNDSPARFANRLKRGRKGLSPP